MNHAPESGLATLLASRGRGDDTMLIHMTPGEVHGLQRLAMAHGGSLTINPHTGLPEAGILKSLLPALIGFGLSFTGLGPLAAAGLVGAGETIRTKGDLGKGLMAGLGAFGGAGLGAGLTAVGTQAAAGATGLGAAGNAPAAFLSGGQQAAQAAASAAGTEAAKQGALQTMGQGIKALGTEAGRNAFMGAIPGGATGIAAGGAGLAGAMTPEYKMPDAQDIDSPYWESYGYDEGQGRFLGGRWLPSYPGVPKKKGKGMADGGIVNPRQDPGGSVITSPVNNATFANKTWEEMPIDPAFAQPNSAKAGWMEFMQKNPSYQQQFIDSGYPAEFFQQNPATFDGNRPFIAGKDEELRASEQARLSQAGYSPTAIQSNSSLTDYMNQLNKFVTSPVAPQRSAAPTQPTNPNTPTPRNPRWDQGLSQFGGNSRFNNINLGGLAGLARARNIDDFLANLRGSDMNYQPDGSFGSDVPPPYSMPPAWGEPPASTQPYEPSFEPAYEPSYFQPSASSPAYEPPAPNYDWMQQPYMAAPAYEPPVADDRVYAGGSPNFDMTGERDMGPPPKMSVPYLTEEPQPIPAIPSQEFEGYRVPPAPAYEPPAPSYTAPEPTPYSEPETYESIMPVDDFYSGKSMKNQAFTPYSFDDSAMMFAAGGPTQYAAGGKFLRGPGDGMSDDIRANIEGRQEARLADGEFVVPADVVSHLGNGSSEAGSRRLYKMMADIRKARTGTHKQAPAVKGEKFLPR